LGAMGRAPTCKMLEIYCGLLQTQRSVPNALLPQKRMVCYFAIFSNIIDKVSF
jgi:hypothetical protein